MQRIIGRRLNGDGGGSQILDRQGRQDLAPQSPLDALMNGRAVTVPPSLSCNQKQLQRGRTFTVVMRSWIKARRLHPFRKQQMNLFVRDLLHRMRIYSTYIVARACGRHKMRNAKRLCSWIDSPHEVSPILPPSPRKAETREALPVI